MDNSINGINTKDWNCLLGLLVCTHCKVESDTEKQRNPNNHFQNRKKYYE